MRKKQSWLLWFVVLAALGVTAWYLYQNNVKADGDPWKMIPATPGIIVQFDDPNSVFDKLATNPIWKSLNNTLLFKRISLRLQQLDTLLSGKMSYLHKLRNSKLFVVIYGDASSKSSQTLFLSAIAINPGLENIKHFLSNRLGPGFAVIIYKYHKYSIFKVIDGIHDMKYYFGFFDGIFAFSMNETLLQQLVDQYSSGKKGIAGNLSIIRLKHTTSKNTDARIYFNYRQLAKLFSYAASGNVQLPLSALSTFALWTETDLMIKQKELLLSGFTTTDKDNNQALSAFKRPANDINVYNILPFNTDILLVLSQRDMDQQQENVIVKMFHVAYRPLIQRLLPLTESEIALFTNALGQRDYNSRLYIALRVDEKGELLKVFNEIAILSGGGKKSVYQQHLIQQIKIVPLWGNIAGQLFSGIKRNYFTQIGDYVVFANTPISLHRLIDYYETGKTLDLNENFKQLSDNLSGRANVSLLLKPRALAGLFLNYLNPKTVKAFKNNLETLNNFENISFQYGHENRFFYTNFYVKFNKSFREENLALWKTTLDDKIVGKPYLVRNHSTGQNDIIVFDKSKQMYLINGNGKILWKKKLVQLPISDIEQVDYYKNGKIQYLFNTRDNLFLIDRKGRFVADYPIRLNPSATNGLSLFDYNRRKNYRILLAQADKRVYSYTIKGNKVRGWIKPKMNNIVADKITRLIANHKDYILITDIDNNVRIVNRKGETRIHIQGRLNKARNSDFYVNRTNSKGIILTTNSNGKLTYISSSGKLRFTDFGKFSPEHYFLYDDFNGDGSRDFIYIDNKKLKVFNKFKKLLFSYTFESSIHTKPVFFRLGKALKVLGVVASEEKTIYLFDKNGNIMISKGLVGEIPFTVGSLKNNKAVNLITATGNTLYDYRIR